jgi:hypothetical protein
MFIQRLRVTVVPFDWSPAGNRFRLSRFPVKLSKKFKKCLNHSLAACEIRKSTIRKAGNGVFIQESALKGQILFKYGGRRISFSEADRLAEVVRVSKLIRLLFFNFITIEFCSMCFDSDLFSRGSIRTSRQS